MHIPLVKRCIVLVFNLIFPPFAVAALAGWTSRDTLINSCLFLLAVIPSHIHGFIISMTYFSRKRKVRKNKFPGEESAFVFSEKVVTGGAGWEQYDELRREERSQSKRESKKHRPRRSSYMSYQSANVPDDEWKPPLPARQSTQYSTNPHYSNY
jgi:uncharacterized membrane protein YqaE (UPF0057 family)